MAFHSRYPFLRRLNFEALYNTFLSIEPREQKIALVGLGVAILLVVGMPLGLASSKLGGLETQITEGHERKRDIARSLEHYRQLKQELKGMEEQISKGFDRTITTTMATLADESQLKGRIQNIRDRGATSLELFDRMTVEVSLTKVTVPQLIDYLYKIEQHPRLFLKIDELEIKRRFDNPQLMDVSFEASTYRLQGAEG